jgi:hypothetical protein
MIARFASSHQHSLNPGPCNVIFSRDQLQGSAVISETTPSPTRSFRLGVLFIPPHVERCSTPPAAFGTYPIETSTATFQGMAVELESFRCSFGVLGSVNTAWYGVLR